MFNAVFVCINTFLTTESCPIIIFWAIISEDLYIFLCVSGSWQLYAFRLLVDNKTEQRQIWTKINLDSRGFKKWKGVSRDGSVSRVNILTFIKQIAGTFCTNIHAPLRMNPNDFGDSYLWFSVTCLDNYWTLPWNLVQTFNNCNSVIILWLIINKVSILFICFQLETTGGEEELFPGFLHCWFLLCHICVQQPLYKQINNKEEPHRPSTCLPIPKLQNVVAHCRKETHHVNLHSPPVKCQPTYEAD